MKPKLIGLLSFYDEPISELVACIKGLHDAGVTALVAVDGAYALYPGGRPSSDPNQHAAIVLACRQLGIGCTLHVPAHVWEGNEVEKRTFLFKLAWAVARPGDWFWVMDADQVVMNVPDGFLEQLERTEHDTAEIETLDVVALRANQRDWPPRFEVRNLFRAQPITVDTNHCTYVAGDGRVLWGGNDNGDTDLRGRPIEGCLDLTGSVLMEHRPHRRPQDRLVAKLCYYTARDEAMVERGECARCGDRAMKLMPTGWRWTEIGPVADWAEACAACVPAYAAESDEQLRELGVDPASVKAENRNGRAPEQTPA